MFRVVRICIVILLSLPAFVMAMEGAAPSVRRVVCRNGVVVPVSHDYMVRLGTWRNMVEDTEHDIHLDDYQAGTLRRLLNLLDHPEHAQDIKNDQELRSLARLSGDLDAPEGIRAVLAQQVVERGFAEHVDRNSPEWGMVGRACRTVAHEIEQDPTLDVGADGALNLSYRELASPYGLHQVPGYNGVQNIVLDRNRLRVLARGSFANLPATCTQLDLSHNDITRVEPRAFDNDQRGLTVDLTGNRLNPAEIAHVRRQVEPGIWHRLAYKAARAAARITGVAHRARFLIAPIARLLIYAKFGHTLPYRLTNVALNIAVHDVQGLKEVPTDVLYTVIDSCHQMGCLPQLKGFVERKMGSSMESINRDPAYGLGWYAQLGLLVGSFCTDCAQYMRAGGVGLADYSERTYGLLNIFRIYNVPRALDSSSLLTRFERHVLNPFGRAYSCTKYFGAAMDCLHDKASRLEQHLALRANRVITVGQR